MNTESSRAALIADVAKSIRAYCTGAITAVETDRLIRLASAIARQKLFGRLRAAAAHDHTSIEQQSISVIAGVFERSGPASPICAALDDVVAHQDDSVFATFQAIVVRTAVQELFHRWSENDPLSAKLWRGLQRVIRHDERILAFPAARPEWAAVSDLESLRPELPPVEHTELLRIVDRIYADQRSLPKVIFDALTEIAELGNFRRAVKIEALFAAIREVVSQRAAARLELAEPLTPDPRFRVAAQAASRAALEHSHAGLGKYLAAGKLHSMMAEAFRKAICDLIDDCMDGGPAQSYFEYIRPHAPDLSLQKYRVTLRAKFEYLAEGAQTAFAEALRREFVGKSLQDDPRATKSDAEGGDTS